MRATRTTPAALVLSLVAGGAASGQEPSVGAVLMVEDEGFARSEVTEPLGAALYGRFLQEGPYSEVVRLQGRQDGDDRLAGAIREVAARHDMVDVFLSVHTTDRDPDRWAERIPPEARKLRLVYSTACYGDEREREAWERLEPRTIVTHHGINNPLLALPRILSGWLDGRSVGDLVRQGYRDTRQAERFLLSLPGAGSFSIPDAGGSRPTVTGDADLKVGAGLWGGADRGAPGFLRFSEERGGSLGLSLRALADPGFRVGGAEVQHLVDQVYLPVALPGGAIEKVESISVEDRSTGKLALRLDDCVEVPLQRDGFALRIADDAEMWPGAIDVANRTMEVHTSGIWVSKGILKVKIDTLNLRPAEDGRGYEVEADIGIFGLIPWSHTERIGGHDPAPLTAEAPIFRPMPATEGLVSALPGD